MTIVKVDVFHFLTRRIRTLSILGRTISWLLSRKIFCIFLDRSTIGFRAGLSSSPCSPTCQNREEARSWGREHYLFGGSGRGVRDFATSYSLTGKRAPAYSLASMQANCKLTDHVTTDIYIYTCVLYIYISVLLNTSVSHESVLDLSDIRRFLSLSRNKIQWGSPAFILCLFIACKFTMRVEANMLSYSHSRHCRFPAWGYTFSNITSVARDFQC